MHHEPLLANIGKLVLGSQPLGEHWILTNIYQYTLPGKWAYVALLFRYVNEDGDTKMYIKPEMVIWDEELQEYLLIQPFDMEATENVS